MNNEHGIERLTQQIPSSE